MQIQLNYCLFLALEMIHFHLFKWVHQLCLRYQIFAFSDLTSPLMSVGKGISQALQRVLPCFQRVLPCCLYRARKFLPPDAILYLYKTNIRPLMEYCCRIWAGAPACHLSLLDRVQKRIVNLVGEELGSSLQPLSHRRSVASLCLFSIYFHGKCVTSVSGLVPPVRVFKRETRLSACSHPYTLALPRCRTKSYSNRFFPRTASLWNSLPGACFPPSYNLYCFKRNINS